METHVSHQRCSPKKLLFPNFVFPPKQKTTHPCTPPQKNTGNNKPFCCLCIFFSERFLPRSLVPTELPPNHPLLASCQAMERQKRFENLHQSEAEETETAKCPESFRMEPIGGGFKLFLCSPRKLGRISNLTIIFFRWVGPTTIQEPMCRFFLSVFLCQ